MQFLQSSVGRKMLMALTGFGMLGFVVVHLLGNTSIFAGPDGINAYASKLHGLGPVIWIFRSVMLALFSVHIFFGIQLTLENREAKPLAYAVKKSLRTTFSAKTMIWTGALIGVFIIFHLLHFTFQIINPDTAALRNLDVMGRPDVFSMVARGFRNIFVSSVYVAAMIVVGLHLNHGLQSMIQSFGLNNDRTLPAVVKTGTVTAVVLFLGYIAIPVVIVMGILKQ